MNQEKRILVCEDSMEGIFSAVYDGWKECAGGCKVSIQTSFPVSMELFTFIGRLLQIRVRLVRL